MEKRIPFMRFQSVKATAKSIDPYLRQKGKLQTQIDTLDEEYKKKEAEAIKKLQERLLTEKQTKLTKLETEIKGVDDQIALFEAGVVNLTGLHVTDLVKKVVETDAKGNHVTKYVPTDIVTYDKANSVFVVTIPETVPYTQDVSDHVETAPEPQVTQVTVEIQEAAAIKVADAADVGHVTAQASDETIPEWNTDEPFEGQETPEREIPEEEKKEEGNEDDLPW